MRPLKDITGLLLDPLQFIYGANRSLNDAVNMRLHYILMTQLLPASSEALGNRTNLHIEGTLNTGAVVQSKQPGAEHTQDCGGDTDCGSSTGHHAH